MSWLWSLVPVEWRWGAIIAGLVVLVGSVLGSYAYVYHAGAAAEAAVCQADNVRNANTWLQLELSIAQAGAAKAQAQAAELAAREMTLQMRLDDYEAAIAKGGGTACLLGDDGAARLRDLVK